MFWFIAILLSLMTKTPGAWLFFTFVMWLILGGEDDRTI